LNELTPKIRCSGKSVDPALIFGIDSKLFRDPLLLPLPNETNGEHHNEVETTTLLRGVPVPTNAHAHAHTTTPSDAHSHSHSHSHPPPKESKAAHPLPPPPPPLLDEPTLTAALRQLPKEYVYRVKGFIRFSPPSASAAVAADSEGLIKPQQERWWILNWAFGRWELVGAPAPAAADEEEGEHGVVRLTVMGERGEVGRYAKRLAEALGATVA
jgi:G3E family GTPase